MEQSIQCALQVVKPGVLFIKKFRVAWCSRMCRSNPQRSWCIVDGSSPHLSFLLLLQTWKDVCSAIQGHILSVGHVGCRFFSWKKVSGLEWGSNPHFHISGVMLYQLSYQAPGSKVVGRYISVSSWCPLHQKKLLL